MTDHTPAEAQDGREALELLLYDTYQDAAGMATAGTVWLHEFTKHYAAIILAAGFTRRPMPSREQLIDLLRSAEHAPMSTHDPRDGSCRECPWPVHMLPPEHIADAVLALFKGDEG